VGEADEVFDGEAVVMVTAGLLQAACVTAKGTLWTWGKGKFDQLGHGDRELRESPTRLGKDMYGGLSAVMVACGDNHTLVLMALSLEMWSCGCGMYGQLGHGDIADKLVLTLVGADGVRGVQIVMVATGAAHSVALGAEGKVWTWGNGRFGPLGHNDGENRLVPTQLPGEALSGAAAVQVVAGAHHTVAVTLEGELWVWGHGGFGQLGLGDETNRLSPTLVGIGESQVLTVACGSVHTLAVTRDGALWTFGKGRNGALGHKGHNNRLVTTRIETQHFGNANIVSVAAVVMYSTAVTEKGALYTWGKASGLGHTDRQAKLVPTLVTPHLLQGERVGRCHNLPPMHALAFAMGTHARLGSAAPTALPAEGSSQDKDCDYVTMLGELVQRVVGACVSWPEGRAVELDGVVRMLGGGMMQTRGCT